MNFVRRLLTSRAKPDLEITKDGEYYTVRTIVGLKISQIKFRCGHLFESMSMDGERVQSHMVCLGNKWIERQFGGHYIEITRELKGDTLEVTGLVDHVMFVRVYKRVKKIFI